MEKKHKIQTACPQCGCSNVNNISEKELKEKYGDVPNIELECHECLTKYHADKNTLTGADKK
jgi:redox-regulated HSP33 family molecular chaperone